DDGGKLGDILVKLGYVAEPDILFAVAEQTGMEVADLDDTDIDASVVDMVPKNVVETYRVCPVGYEAGVLVVALADPMNPTVRDDLRFMTNGEVRGAVSTPDAVDRAIVRYYGAKEDDSLARAMAEAGLGADDVEAVEEGKK